MARNSGLYVAMALVFTHIALACARGGKLRYFLWPFNVIWFIRRLFRGGYYAEARDAVWDFTMALRLPHYFWLGLRGFVVGFAWLAIPVSLLALGHSKLPAAPLIGVGGGVLLAVVLLYLPFLQLRLAATGRFLQGFNFLAVRRQFRWRRGPLRHRSWSPYCLRCPCICSRSRLSRRKRPGSPG